MKYNQPYGVVDTNAAYVNGNPSSGIEGSVPSAETMEYPQREIVAVIAYAGMTPSNGSLTQLRDALLKLFPIAAQNNPTVYVRSDGNDANDGSANDAGHAFLTINGALTAALKTYALGGKVLTIQLGTTGTWTEAIQVPAAAGSIKIRGNPAAPGSYVIQSSGSGLSGCFQAIGSNLTFEGVTVQNTGSTAHTVAAAYGGVVTLLNTALTCTTTNAFFHTFAFPGGAIVLQSVTISSNMGGWAGSSGGNVSAPNGSSQVFSGSPAWSVAGVSAIGSGALITLAGSISGSATGKRFDASLNGVVNAFGNSGSLPGSVTGTSATGGQAS